MSAIDAGKHVYCEWPLGRNTAKGVGVLDTAKRRAYGTLSACTARCHPRSTTSKT